jgi:hypothetical protein
LIAAKPTNVDGTTRDRPKGKRAVTVAQSRAKRSGAPRAYQFTAAVGGGLTPLIATWLVGIGGGSGNWAAAYMAAVCAIALVTTVAVRERIRATHHTGAAPDPIEPATR